MSRKLSYMSLPLRLAQEDANVTLIDYSEQALANSKEVFDDAGLAASYIHADIAQLPMPEKFYDVVWNAGVLEHFSYEEQVSILKELARVTKDNGLLIILTPSAAALAYRVGKFTAEQAGIWMYGTETPIQTLTTAFQDAGIELLEEYNTGFFGSLEFLDFVNGAAPVKEAMKSWFLSLPEEEQPLFPGYLLCTVGIVRSDPGQVKASEAPEASQAPAEEAESSNLLTQILKVQAAVREAHLSSEGEPSSDLLEFQHRETATWLPLLPVLDHLLRSAPTEEKPLVLDIGPAYGTLMLYSAWAGAEAYGIDKSNAYWSEKLAEDYDLSWSLCNIEAQEIPGAHAFHVILLTSVLEYLHYNPVPVFQHIYNRLKPNGSLLISTPWKRAHTTAANIPALEQLKDYDGEALSDPEDETVIKLYSSDEILALAEASGFIVQTLQVLSGCLNVWLIKPSD